MGQPQQEPTTPFSLLQQHAQRAPDAACVVHLESGTTLTYQGAWQAAQRLARLLAEHGVGRRDRVVFAVRNHWLIFPLLAACSARRAILVPVDPELHRDELAFILSDAAPALTIAADGVAVPGGGRATLTLTQLLAALANTAAAEDASEEEADTALMIYTSGTTGNSKCVMLTSANLMANAASLARRYQVRAEDRFFCTLPTHHMNALMMTGMVPLTAGACVCLADVLSFKNAKRYFRLLAEHDITIFSVVPSIMALLLRLSPDGQRPPTPRLRFGFCGAAPLPANLWQRFEAIFGSPIYQGYGLTETTCWAVSTPPDQPRRYDTVGVPLDCEVRIDSAPFDDLEALVFTPSDAAESAGAAQGTGEVLIRGPIVGPGYYKNPRLTAECTTRDGFFRTGDLGFFDADGSLHISGRLKEVIIRNGTNIFSRDIDRVLCQHEAVKESKTLSVRDDLVGERVYSVCVLEEGHALTELALRRWAQERLSHHMWPDAVVFMGYLPAGAAGKISINTLRKIVAGELADEILASLNSWRYKRAQPAGAEAIRARVQRSLTAGAPIPFLSYWGCGTRDALAEPDQQALVRLRDYVNGARRVPQASPALTLILTDMHARNNGVPLARMRRYFGAVRDQAAQLGMEVVLLSELWTQAGLSPEQIEAELREPAFHARWQAEPLRERLVQQAQKHFEPSPDAARTPEAAARFYYQACLREGAAIAARYPEHLFLTYNPPDLDCLSPPLPRLYLYSYKEGTSVKPWFTDER